MERRACKHLGNGPEQETRYIKILETMFADLYFSASHSSAQYAQHQHPHQPGQQCVQAAGHLVREQHRHNHQLQAQSRQPHHAWKQAPSYHVFCTQQVSRLRPQ